jgi:hypothetical protein
MNVFNADVVTGVATGLQLDGHPPQPLNQIGTFVVSNGFFSSDGSYGSTLETDADNGSAPDPATFHEEPWQGFWFLLTN